MGAIVRGPMNLEESTPPNVSSPLVIVTWVVALKDTPKILDEVTPRVIRLNRFSDLI